MPHLNLLLQLLEAIARTLEDEERRSLVKKREGITQWLLNAIVYPLSRSAIADVDGSTIAQYKIKQQRFSVPMPDSIQ